MSNIFETTTEILGWVVQTDLTYIGIYIPYAPIPSGSGFFKSGVGEPKHRTSQGIWSTRVYTHTYMIYVYT